jgi:hypothetical protein
MALSRSVYANFAAFPGSGVADVIYVDASNNNQFLWNGTTYVSYAPEQIGVLLGNKPDAWFTANPEFILGNGQILLLNDGFGLYVDAYKLGDGKTELQNLAWKGLKEDLNIHSAGLIDGGEITINSVDNTKIDIAPLTGVIVDYWTNPGATSVNYIDYPGATAVSVTNLATSTLSYICIDKDGTIIQYATAPTDAQRRDVIVLAQLGHAANTIIASVNSYVSVFASPVEQLRDLFYEFKLINEGNFIVANGANLQINKSNGFLFGFGINYFFDEKQPNKRNIPAQTAASFRYRTQTGGTTTPVNLIDPTQYDNAGTITAISGGGNHATNQRVFLFPNGNIVIQYGQTIYNTLQLAIQGVQSENFNQFINVSEAAILIGIISVTKGCTALNNTTNARFIPVTKFGENIGGAAGISVSNLQNAYDNSNEPEIVTDSTRWAVTIKRGSASDSDNLIEFVNGSNVITNYIKANGESTFEPLQNKLISGGTLTIGTFGGIGTNNDVRIAAAAWYISGSYYSTAINTDFLDLALSGAGLQRFVAFYGDNTNTILKVEGTESEFAAMPTTPANSILIDYILVTDGGLGIAPDLSEYALINPRVRVVVSELTPSFDVDAYDELYITALAGNITSMSTNITGTLSNGRTLIYKIKDNGVGRTISWGASFSNKFVTLPTTTTANKELLIALKYNSSTSLLEAVAWTQQL